MKTKSIRQTIKFKASPKAVYETLMSSKKHSKFTGAPAKISRKVGGTWHAYKKSLRGTNLELKKDKKIVQSWWCAMKHWPKKHFSRATFTLKKVKGGTQLNFFHSGVPIKSYKMVKQGWHDYYWKPMKKMLNK